MNKMSGTAPTLVRGSSSNKAQANDLVNVTTAHHPNACAKWLTG